MCESLSVRICLRLQDFLDVFFPSGHCQNSVCPTNMLIDISKIKSVSVCMCISVYLFCS